MECAEDLLKFVCKYVLEKSTEDVNFLSKRVDKTIVENLQFMTSGSLEKISYTEAVEILKQVKVFCHVLTFIECFARKIKHFECRHAFLIL